MFENVYIIIPAKNEQKHISGVIKQTQEIGFKNIILVDDGSTDLTAVIAKQAGANVVSHYINMGAGAATQTGIDLALKLGAKYMVTMDADHQHQPVDIIPLIEELEKGEADIVIGSRFLRKNHGIPLIRVLYNKIANVITWLITGVAVSDSQSGMKAFNQKFAKNSKLLLNGFEFSVEMIGNIRTSGSKVIEKPIQVIYTKETLKKGQNLWQGTKMLAKLLRLSIR